MFGPWRFIVPIGVGVLTHPVAACAGTDDKCKPKTSTECGEPAAQPKKCKKVKEKCEDANPTELERCIAKCREDFVPVKNAFFEYSDQAVALGKDTTKAVLRNVNYLQNCAPLEVKVGTIIGSGLFGMLLGFRRGLIRKIFYGTLASTTAAAIIYPAEAKVVACQGFVLTKKYVKKGYRYVTGTEGTCKKECKKAKKAAGDCPPSKEG